LQVLFQAIALPATDVRIVPKSALVKSDFRQETRLGGIPMKILVARGLRDWDLVIANAVLNVRYFLQCKPSAWVSSEHSPLVKNNPRKLDICTAGLPYHQLLEPFRQVVDMHLRHATQNHDALPV
jgi:hypothetical protein